MARPPVSASPRPHVRYLALQMCLWSPSCWCFVIFLFMDILQHHTHWVKGKCPCCVYRVGQDWCFYCRDNSSEGCPAGCISAAQWHATPRHCLLLDVLVSSHCFVEGSLRSGKGLGRCQPSSQTVWTHALAVPLTICKIVGELPHSSCSEISCLETAFPSRW